MLKKVIKNYISSFGKRIELVTPAAELSDFLKKLYPKETNHELIRLGSKNDGGYLIPDDLIGIKNCFSPGVSTKASFEEDLAKRGIYSYLADYSVDSAPVENSFFTFDKKFLSSINNDIYSTLECWINKHVDLSDSDMILQMDIESSEYNVLIDTPQTVLNRFRIIVIEFHEVDQILNPFVCRILNAIFDKLLTNFTIVHIHPNNSHGPITYKEFEVPPILEFTFLRNDRISKRISAGKFPHKLDAPNLTDVEDFPLPKCWYKN